MTKETETTLWHTVTLAYSPVQRFYRSSQGKNTLLFLASGLKSSPYYLISMMKKHWAE